MLFDGEGPLSAHIFVNPRFHTVTGHRPCDKPGAAFCKGPGGEQRASQEGTWELYTLADQCLFLGPDRGLGTRMWWSSSVSKSM